MTRIDDEREQLQQPPRVFLMPPLMVVEPSPNSSVVITQVWAANADSKFQIISSLVDKYRFVSIDIEFPSVVILACNKNYRNLVPKET
ncbi:hypothetical protein HN51_040756 [Arachis hypogaea]